MLNEITQILPKNGFIMIDKNQSGVVFRIFVFRTVAYGQKVQTQNKLMNSNILYFFLLIIERTRQMTYLDFCNYFFY